jgi:phage terminase large subunit
MAATLNPVLRDFWLTPARVRVLYGGRFSSKSWDAAGFATFLAQAANLRILCARQFQNKIAESVYTLLKIQIERFGLLDDFKITDNAIVHRRTRTEFLFMGLWGHIDEIKSLEGIDVLWIEEGHNLTKEQWEIIEPTIRAEGSQIWIIFNPRLATDFAYKRFVLNPPANAVVRKINYDENPFLSQTARDVAEAARLESLDDYEHIYLGVPRADDDGVVIRRTWIQAAIDAHLTLKLDITGSKRIGFDVADGGPDKCANIYVHGWVTLWADEWKAGEDELLQSSARTYDAARERQAMVIYDSIGVGAMVGSKINEVNTTRKAGGDNFRITHTGFNAGSTAIENPDDEYQPGTTNKDMFANVKAQAWWMVADRFRNTYDAVRNGKTFRPDQMISISSDCPLLDRLIDELATPKRNYDTAGKVKVESKKDLAKRGVPSPNLADAFIMANLPFTDPLEIWRALAAA